ncbi:ankyrin repeat-containing domain protein, partial [Ampelomyces quisqualis]
LQSCARSGHINSIKFLVRSGVQVATASQGEIPALFQAIAANQTQVVHLRFDVGARLHKPSDYGPEALCGAAEVNNLEGAKMLFDVGVQASCFMPNGDFPLLLAAKAGWVGMVELLITSHADPNSQDRAGQTAMMAASIMGHIPVLQLLLDNDALMDKQ